MNRINFGVISACLIVSTSAFRTPTKISAFTKLSKVYNRRSISSFAVTEPSVIAPTANPLEDGTLNHILNTAEVAARKAGDLIRANIGARVKYSKANYKDVVTEIDIASQKIIEQTIIDAFPSHGFLGEESVEAGHCASVDALEFSLAGEGKEWLWCVDPIDGTTNFASGMPGQGSFCNGVRMKVAEGDLREAVVNCGYPVGNPVATATSMRGFGALSSRVRGLRVIACAAQVMAWVAQGKLSAYYSYDLNAWDVAAGALLILEAGGSVTDLRNVPYSLRTRDMLCSQGSPVHDDILHTLSEVDAISYEEEECQLPDFLNVRRTKMDPSGKPKTFWYDEHRGQN
eukprot:gene9835-20454_t